MKDIAKKDLVGYGVSLMGGVEAHLHPRPLAVPMATLD